MIQTWLNRIARFLYVWLRNSPLSALCFPKSVQRDVQAVGRKEEDYYIQKFTYVCGLFLAGMILILVYLLCFWISGSRQIERVERPKTYEKAQEIVLKTGKQEDVFYLEIEPVLLNKEEADVQIKNLMKQLEKLILGKNESLEQVREDLLLVEYVEGYPFEIYWESDHEKLLDSTGAVDREGLKEDCIVVLKATFYYSDWVWYEQFAVLVEKENLSEEEEYTRELEEFLKEAEADQRELKEWELPETFEGEPLFYQMVEEDFTILLLVGLMFAAGIAVWIGQDQDLHNSRNKRREVFQAEYVSFSGSLSLYISAGLNLHMALQFCAKDYARRKPKEHLLRAALVEFQKDIQNGYGFLEALEKLAEVADDANYRRLVGVLSQGMINGSQGLTALLEKEVDRTREEKRRQSKAEGERISTALIAPMLLQLGIVIALIMIPAFMNMQF